jgi:hypothetical protein
MRPELDAYSEPARQKEKPHTRRGCGAFSGLVVEIVCAEVLKFASRSTASSPSETRDSKFGKANLTPELTRRVLKRACHVVHRCKLRQLLSMEERLG